MADPTLVRFDFNALHRQLSARTGRVLERAAFLLTAADTARENRGLVPNVEPPGIPVKLEPRPVAAVRREGAGWITECAFRDCLEEVQAFLEQVRRTCAALSLVGTGDVAPLRFQEIVFAPAAAFDKKGFPEKVRYLRTEFGPTILDPLIDDILTLNAARNCLVHRRGVVSERDCHESGRLVVRWHSLELHVRVPSGDERPLPIGEVLSEGGQLLTKRRRHERSFEVGDQVMFSNADLSGIWLMLHFFGVGTSKNVSDLGSAKGLVADSEPPGGDL